MDYVEQIPSTDLMYGPGGNLLKVVIVPTPLDAQVIIEAGEYVPINNVVYVLSGTSVTYTVVKNGYISKSDTVTVTESQNIYVELEKEQENMIYGWSTGVSESWSTPFDLGVYAFSRSLYANHKFYMLDGANRRMASSVNGVESWDFVDLSPASEIQYYSGIAYGSSKLMLCGHDSNSRSYYFFLEDIGNYLVRDLPVGFYPVNDLVYGDGKFVIVGANKVAVTANDGESWVVTEVAGATFIKVIYGDGKFVAGCLSGKLFVSEDGVNWTEGSQVFSDQITALTYGNGKFIAWQSRSVSVSEDGENWSNPVSWVQLSGLVDACSYGNGKFIAISYQGVVLSSEDGINWNAAGNISAYEWTTVCYGNGKFVASGDEGYFSFLDTQTFYSQVEYPVADDYLFDSDGNIISRVISANEYKAWEFSKDGINFTGYTTSIYPSSGDTVYSDTSGTISFTVEGLGTFTLTVGSCDYKSITVIPSTAYSWTPAIQVSNLGNRSWNGLAYDGTKFVALDASGYISTSTDGTTWTPAIQVSNLGNRSWRALAYDGTKFVALGFYGGWISTSTDGTTWTTATQDRNLGSHFWQALAYDGTKFVALGDSGDLGYVSTSTDGVTWTPAIQDSNLGSHDWQALAYDGYKYVALSQTGFVSTSTDGTIWTTATQVSNLGNHSWNGLAYDGIKFVALGYPGYISTSTDGTTWTIATQDSNLGDLGNNGWRALAYDGTKFVTLGSNIYISTCQAATKMKRELQLDETSSLIVQSNIDVSNWKVPVEALEEPEQVGTYTGQWFGLAYDGYKYVALSQTGFISTSVNGEIWTEPLYVSNLGDTFIWQYLLYDGTRFLALSEEGYVSTSLDGINWEPAVLTSLGSQRWEVIAFDGSVYVAISATGYTGSSTDGINWSNVVQNNNLKSNVWYAMAYGYGRFVAISTGGKVSRASKGTTTWSQAVAQSQLAGHRWNSIVWNGSHFIAMAADGYVSKSVDGNSWEAAYPTRLSADATERGVKDWDKVVYDGRRLLAVSQLGYVSTAEGIISRDKTLDKVSKNKMQYFTVYGGSTSLNFANLNNVAHFPSPIVIDWGDGKSQRVNNVSSVSHSYIEYPSTLTNGYFQIKIISSSGLLSLTRVNNLYSWDSVLLPMVEADGVSYATRCTIFRSESPIVSICSSPFQNSVYKKLDGVFYNSWWLSKISINNLKEVREDYFESACVSSVEIANFNKLKYATSAFHDTFYQSSILKNVNFDSLISVYGSNFLHTFYSCSSLTSVVFPVLESIQGSNCFEYAFLNDINLTEVEFPSLKYINGDSVFNGAFANTAVTDLYFPSLSPVNVDNGQFNGILEGNSNLKIHLPINLEGKFSVGNTYYDLPPSEE